MPKFLLNLPPELRERIEEYRWRHRIRSITEAILKLLEDALSRDEKRGSK